jgi:hypothetical protein
MSGAVLLENMPSWHRIRTNVHICSDEGAVDRCAGFPGRRDEDNHTTAYIPEGYGCKRFVGCIIIVHRL